MENNHRRDFSLSHIKRILLEDQLILPWFFGNDNNVGIHMYAIIVTTSNINSFSWNESLRVWMIAMLPLFQIISQLIFLELLILEWLNKSNNDRIYSLSYDLMLDFGSYLFAGNLMNVDIRESLLEQSIYHHEFSQKVANYPRAAEMARIGFRCRRLFIPLKLIMLFVLVFVDNGVTTCSLVLNTIIFCFNRDTIMSPSLGNSLEIERSVAREVSQALVDIWDNRVSFYFPRVNVMILGLFIPFVFQALQNDTTWFLSNSVDDRYLVAIDSIYTILLGLFVFISGVAVIVGDTNKFTMVVKQNNWKQEMLRCVAYYSSQIMIPLVLFRTTRIMEACVTLWLLIYSMAVLS